MAQYICGNLGGLPIPSPSYYDITGDGKKIPSYKDMVVRDIAFDMFERTQSMFKYDGLPDSIPQRMLELYLQMNGHCCFYRHEGVMYVFFGGLGGVPDPYYMPTIYTIANPALSLFKQARIGEDCVVVSNDSLYRGLSRLISKYATALCENEISIKLAQINSRIVALLNANSDVAETSCRKYLDDVYDGRQGVIGDGGLFDGINVQPYADSASVTNIKALIELEQYLKASMYNDLGLNANFNMKRESLNSAESALNDDSLFPLVDDMLRCRRVGLEKVNEMFGTDISVEFASSWRDNKIEIAMAEAQSSEEAPEDIPEESSEEAPEDIPEESSEEAPEDIPEETPEDIIEAIADAAEIIAEAVKDDDEEEVSSDGE